MEGYTLCQGEVTATLSDIRYAPAEGFFDQGTAHVAKESIVADADIELQHGPGKLRYKGKEYPIVVSVFEPAPSDGEADEGEELVWMIEIKYPKGLERLARELDLV